MNKKRIIICLLISLLAAMAFAACSKDVEPETPTTEEVVEETVVEETQVSEEAEAPVDEPVAIEAEETTEVAEPEVSSQEDEMRDIIIRPVAGRDSLDFYDEDDNIFSFLDYTANPGKYTLLPMNTEVELHEDGTFTFAEEGLQMYYGGGYYTLRNNKVYMLRSSELYASVYSIEDGCLVKLQDHGESFEAAKEASTYGK